MSKDLKKIFIVLVLYSLAGGFLYNFQELWMESNNLSVKTIGTVYSICALLSVSTIFLCSNLIKQKMLKKFTLILLVTKAIIILILFLLNMTGLNVLIKFLIMIDYVIDVEIYACIYPMMALTGKSDKKYALRGIIYEIAYYIAVILTVALLGKTIGTIKIDYNLYCLFASIFLIIAFLVLKSTKLEQHYDKKEEKTNLNKIGDLVKKISKDKIIKNYFIYLFFNNISYKCLTGLMLIILTNYLNFSASSASNLKMVLGITSSVLGIIILSKLTLKNNYINLSIKYVTRFILYVLAIITTNKIVFLVALIFTRASSESYGHVSDAPYINRVDTKDQLAFCNLREMISYFAKSIGALLCGISLATNIVYNFVFAAVFTGIGIIFSFYALYLRNKEAKGEKI